MKVIALLIFARLGEAMNPLKSSAVCLLILGFFSTVPANAFDIIPRNQFNKGAQAVACGWKGHYQPWGTPCGPIGKCNGRGACCGSDDSNCLGPPPAGGTMLPARPSARQASIQSGQPRQVDEDHPQPRYSGHRRHNCRFPARHARFRLDGAGPSAEKGLIA